MAKGGAGPSARALPQVGPYRPRLPSEALGGRPAPNPSQRTRAPFVCRPAADPAFLPVGASPDHTAGMHACPAPAVSAQRLAWPRALPVPGVRVPATAAGMLLVRRFAFSNT